MTKPKSLIKRKWVSLDLGNNGYDKVLNVETKIVLDPQAKGYDDQKVVALVEEVKPFLEHYDRATVYAKPDK